MDPNELLRRLKELALKLQTQMEKTQESGNAVSLDEYEVMELTEGVINLDDWIRNGGFLPQEWNHSK